MNNVYPYLIFGIIITSVLVEILKIMNDSIITTRTLKDEINNEK